MNNIQFTPMKAEVHQELQRKKKLNLPGSLQYGSKQRIRDWIEIKTCKEKKYI